MRRGACRVFAAVLIALIVSSVATELRAGSDSDAHSDCMKDLMFVFDASGSMGTTDLVSVSPHILRVKNAFRRIVNEIPRWRRMGLIVYGEGEYNRCDSIELKVPPQQNAGPAILAEVDKIEPAGRTPLTQSIGKAAEVLDFRRNPSVVVLLTDGEETCGGKPCELADRLKADAKDITIHVIGYRHAEASGIGGPFGARCLADETGGLYLPVETEDQIVEALRKTLVCPLTTTAPTAPIMRAAISILNRRFRSSRQHLACDFHDALARSWAKSDGQKALTTNGFQCLTLRLAVR